jgi:hypothetical protein
MKEPGRNDPCLCGSGKKFKNCCWIKTHGGKKKISAKILSGTGTKTAELLAKPTYDVIKHTHKPQVDADGKVTVEAEKPDLVFPTDPATFKKKKGHEECGEGCTGHH